MNIYNTQDQTENSQDEEDNFSRYMDENGIIGMEDDEFLAVDEQGIVGEQEIWELEEPRILDLGMQGIMGINEERIMGLDEVGIMGLDEEGLLQLTDKDKSLDSHTDEDISGLQSLDDQFSFSQVEKEGNHEFPENHDTDNDPSSEDHPGISLSLPPPLDWHPPSRDQQLDMTEDEMDRGSSVEIWEEEEGASWSQGTAAITYNSSISPMGFYESGQESKAEEKISYSPQSSIADLYPPNPIINEEEPHILSLSPSTHPTSSPWNPRHLAHLGGKKVSHRIEDETLPESSVTDSGDGLTPGDALRSSTSHCRVHNSLPAQPSSTRHKRHHTDPIIKPTKPLAVPPYGRGQLNYPLPDFSKVGPRVRLPREDQIYQPPQPRKPDVLTRGTPVIFKSPAEIVREVLLTSTEKPIGETLQATVPQEFQTPEQATQLVHQLQKDYHKLLTKYAEAENTIDRLRLGARVNLYSDPPKPSHSINVGIVSQGSKPLEFTLPQLQVATFSSVSETAGDAKGDSGVSAPNVPTTTLQQESFPATAPQNTADDVEATIAAHIDALREELALFDKLSHAGKLTPEQQRQAVMELRASLEGLEHRYLRARDNNHQGKHQTNKPEELDAQRALEGAIFQLGVQLDEIQDRVEDSIVRSQAQPTTDALTASPVPSSRTPRPAIPPSYPEVRVSTDFPAEAEAELKTMSSDKEVVQDAIPQPLRHKQMQVEKEYDALLSTYSSFKTLPHALELEQAEWTESQPQVTVPQGHLQDTRPQEYQQINGHQNHHPALKLHENSQVVRFNESVDDTKPQDYSHSKRPPERPPSNKSLGPVYVMQSYVNPAVTSRQDHPRANGTHNHLHGNRHNMDVQTTKSQDHIPSRSSRGRAPTHSPPVAQTHSQSEQRRASNAWLVEEMSSPGKHTRSKSLSKRSQAIKPHDSLSHSSIPRVRRESTNIPRKQRFFSGERPQSSQSQRSSVSDRSVSSSAQREPTKDKRTTVQDGVVSPETDSGFLGSEGSNLSPIQKQMSPLIRNREFPHFSNTSPKQTDKMLSQSYHDQTAGTRKAFRERRQKDDQWRRPSRSPSLGANSLTESREQSPAGVSDFENDDCSDGITSVPSNASLPPSPAKRFDHSNGNFLETRAVREQAIYDLQKEVTHLRKHLEKCLNSSPAQEKPEKNQPSPTFHNLQEERVPPLAFPQQSLLTDSVSTLQELRAEYPRTKVAPDGPNHGIKNVCGAYTGTSYHAPDPPVPAPCPLCRSARNPGTAGILQEGDNISPVPPPCDVCHENAASARRNDVSECHMTRRGSRCHRAPRSGHWVLSETPPVTMSYIQTPIIYHAPGIYTSSPNLYVPMGYSVSQPSHTMTLPSEPYRLQPDDISRPLNRALEAAKELKITSKKMCRSLTSDLGSQRRLRGSCLF
ncbi:microtubule organization protein AKNA isoform X2 [Bombina bombina]|uniref:microtubule organization protein AKNA isoform X2 n=1 Tax=Bombina bombina TaxID=8345 RepID=UPI00235A4A65|nr:microtubule organization protein AKNA isoform X2 [Bombina bombina]